MEPEICPEFDSIDGNIRTICFGEKHMLVLTYEGTVYTKGESVYGNTGHGGARAAPEFTPVKCLADRKMRLIAAGPNYSFAITHDGDVYSWGQAFNCETGLFSQVDTVPRFAPGITPFRVNSISCGHAHVLAVTTAQRCIAWGENTCGQLGLGEKTKPTAKPQSIDIIPSQIAMVSAGWAHSVAVSVEGRVYSWGLNSHGQLGLGDTKTRFAPNLIHDLVGKCEIETAHASRVLTVFHASNKQAMLCGQVPCSHDLSKETLQFRPQRPAPATDPKGCVLSPVPLHLSGAQSELTQIIAFDRGAIGFARSTVFQVKPNLAPISGKTKVQVMVTGLPFDPNDSIPVKVRLKSSSPLCDVIVPGVVVANDTVEFETPSVALSPLGAAVEQGITSAVELQVSIDNGLTWTLERRAASPPQAVETETNRTTKLRTQVGQGLQEFKDEFARNRQKNSDITAAETVLWYCRWPKLGATHLEPTCAPAMTLSCDPPMAPTELLVHVELPKMPPKELTVKFTCKPKTTAFDNVLAAASPVRMDLNAVAHKDKETVDQLPLIQELDVFTCGWLDPAGRGVRCHVPEFNKDHVKYFDYFVDLSLDGRCYLGNLLPFNAFDLHVVGLEPDSGPISADTTIVLKTTGLVPTDVYQVRIDFQGSLAHHTRIMHASFDHTLGEITFVMPELVDEVRNTLPSKKADAADADGHVPAEPKDTTIDSFSVFVELSLNGQNFTQDQDGTKEWEEMQSFFHKKTESLEYGTTETKENRPAGYLASTLGKHRDGELKHACNIFKYYGKVEAGPVRMLAPPDGISAEPEKKEEAPKKGGKKGDPAAAKEEALPAWLPGSKVGCELTGAITEAKFAKIRVQLMIQVEGEEPKPYLDPIDLPGTLERLLPPSTPATPAPDEEAPKPRDFLTAVLPGLTSDDLPEGAILTMTNFLPSLNGQFKDIQIGEGTSPVRLEPLPREASPES
jgi:hypothetical protein